MPLLQLQDFKARLAIAIFEVTLQRLSYNVSLHVFYCIIMTVCWLVFTLCRLVGAVSYAHCTTRAHSWVGIAGAVLGRWLKNRAN